MILLVVFAVLIWMFWYYNAEEVRNGVRWLRYGEMWVISWFIKVFDFIGLTNENYQVLYNGKLVDWQQGFEATPKFHKDALRYDHLVYFSALALQPLRIIFFVLAALGAIWAIFKGPKTHYRTRLDLEGLIHRQAKNFAVIAPFVDFNPATQPPRPPGSPVPGELPPFAEALGPEEWLAYNTIPFPDGVMDEAAAAAAFKTQLYGRWKGPKALKPYQQILLAAFCLKAARKRVDSDEMLGRLALCWSHKRGLNLKRDRRLLGEAQKILRNGALAGTTLAKCNQHAFVTTAMLRALSTAREEGGVLAPSQFVWLRAYDRTLWYPLNNLGRHSFHMEALGAMAHFKAEKMTQRPIPVPKIESAVETIKNYMLSARARPIPPLDYAGTGKRGIKKAV
ncbi:MAG: type IV secretion system protein [Alphaproteobacteria bacterium]|nr:type IV secretion system protein [Alphaproteobacteria bacterium]